MDLRNRRRWFHIPGIGDQGNPQVFNKASLHLLLFRSQHFRQPANGSSQGREAAGIFRYLFCHIQQNLSLKALVHQAIEEILSKTKSVDLLRSLVKEVPASFTLAPRIQVYPFSHPIHLYGLGPSASSPTIFSRGKR